MDLVVDSGLAAQPVALRVRGVPVQCGAAHSPQVAVESLELAGPGPPCAVALRVAKTRDGRWALRRDWRAGAIYFFPIYTGQTIPYADWRARMWLDTWI